MFVQRRPLTQRGGCRQRPARRVRRGVVWEEQAAPELAVVLVDGDAVLAQRAGVPRTVFELGRAIGLVGGIERRARQAGEADRTDPLDQRRAERVAQPVEFAECGAVEGERRFGAPAGNGVVQVRGGAAEQESPVAPGRSGGDPSGVDPDDGQPAGGEILDRGETGRAQAHHARVRGAIAVQRRQSGPVEPRIPSDAQHRTSLRPTGRSTRRSSPLSPG